MYNVELFEILYHINEGILYVLYVVDNKSPMVQEIILLFWDIFGQCNGFMVSGKRLYVPQFQIECKITAQCIIYICNVKCHL